MSGIGAKWHVQRYGPSPTADLTLADEAFRVIGKPQVFDKWRDVVEACDTIVGDNNLMMGVEPTVPVVLKNGDDIVLLYLKLVC